MKVELKFTKQDNSTVEYGHGSIHLLKPILNYASYQRDAINVLDKLSKDLNPQGIDFFLTAIIEAIESGYYGKGNQVDND